MSGYGNLLDKVKAQNFANIRKAANNNVTVNGPNSFTCILFPRD